MKLETFRAALPQGELWVFGYGSLMWSPCFTYREKHLARVHGYHRALCILSTRYRGTQRKPGLVMGLCRGGSCWGMAFRVDAARVRHALARLWAREMPRRAMCCRGAHPRQRVGQARALGREVEAHEARLAELDPGRKRYAVFQKER